MAKVLVVGGAGYVGSAACAWLLDHGHRVWVLDDLSTGRRELLLGEGFLRARAGARDEVLPLLRAGKFDAVMHFAAKALVAESVEKPELYHENNVEQTRLLIEAMLEAGVRRFIFSSTCAIFGDPGTDRIGEDLPKRPVNPYGLTKLQVEQMLERLAREKGLRSIALRYFNAAGAEPKLRVGEWHETETHLIPNVLKAALEGRPVSIYGTDYPTPDGTCIRDYISVWDLAAAHGAALERLLTGDARGGSFEAFNLGSESGYSVREVIDVCEEVTGRKIRRIEKPRRAGDPPVLVADSRLARGILGFRAEVSLREIVTTAWQWEGRHSQGSGRAVFLDRDGTINEDPGYLSDPTRLMLYPGVGEALARLKRSGFEVIVVSNQSGVGRGLIPPESLVLVHDRLDELLRADGAKIDLYELCTHRPDDGCECRKPKPALILAASRRRGIDLSRSYVVGDKESDLLAGINAGCRASVLVRTGHGEETRAGEIAKKAAFIAADLREAVDWILKDAEAGSQDRGSAGS